MSRIRILALDPFHLQNCGMPDSDPSSSNSTHSDREIPAEDAGDGCRRRDYLRCFSGIFVLRTQPASSPTRLTVSETPTASRRLPIVFISEERPVCFILWRLGHLPHEGEAFIAGHLAFGW